MNVKTYKPKHEELFKSFCYLVCRGFIRNRSRNNILVVINALSKVGSLEILLDQAKKFKKENPKKIYVEYKPEFLSGGHIRKDFLYKEKASRFIKTNTGIEIPVSLEISSTFYEKVINGCITYKK